MAEPWEVEALPEAAFSLTCKSGKGYDADMLTIRGMSWDDFEANASAALGEDIAKSKLQQLRMVPQDATGGAPANNSPAPANNGGGNAGDWKAKAPNCAHGQMEAKEWVGKTGKIANKTQYTYFCPQPREANDKCTPVDAITGKTWGS